MIISGKAIPAVLIIINGSNDRENKVILSIDIANQLFICVLEKNTTPITYETKFFINQKLITKSKIVKKAISGISETISLLKYERYILEVNVSIIISAIQNTGIILIPEKSVLLFLASVLDNFLK